MLTTALVAVLGVAGVAWGASPEGDEQPPSPNAQPGDLPSAGTLKMTFLDVGQGDAALLLSPTGKSVLIDAGLQGAAPRVLAALGDAGIRRLDLVVATHAHADHIGAMNDVLRKVPTELFMDSGFPHPSGTYRQLLEYLETSKTRVVTARRGRKIDLGGGAHMEVLEPRDDLLRGTRSDANSNSVVVRVTLGDVAVLMTGDAEAPTERRLLEQPGRLAATVLKVAHHGSAHSSTEAFLGAVKPEAAVISCGVDNRYGHPAPSTLRALTRRGAGIYRTDLHGDIVLTTDGKRWQIRRQGKAGPVAEGQEGLGAGDMIDINTADAATLATLPGIGPRKAEAIVNHRERSGRFGSIDDVTAVRGIGTKTLERLRPLIRASGSGKDP